MRSATQAPGPKYSLGYGLSTLFGTHRIGETASVLQDLTLKDLTLQGLLGRYTCCKVRVSCWLIDTQGVRLLHTNATCFPFPAPLQPFFNPLSAPKRGNMGLHTPTRAYAQHKSSYSFANEIRISRQKNSKLQHAGLTYRVWFAATGR